MSSTIGTTSTGGVFIGGTESGINTTALIEAAVAQKTRRADLLDIEVKENISTMNAYDELLSLTNAVDASLQQLKGPESFFDDTERVFDLKSGTVLTSDGSDFSSILDIAIDSDAVAGAYEIEVVQVAQPQKVAGTSVVDDTADLGYTGTFDIGLSDGGAVSTINVTADMSLAELATAINSQSETTGVGASVIKVAEDEFQLVLTGQETNRTIEVTAVTGDDTLNLVGVTDGIGGFQNQLQAAQEAIIEFDGVTVTRDDNNFDDLIDGIELNLKNEAPGTLISLEVDNDAAAVRDAITTFIDAYNAFRDFVVQNQQIDSSGNIPESASLFSDNLLNGLANQYSNILALNFSNGGDIQTIRDLGITIGNNNKLEIFDPARLDTALLNNFEEVKAAFASGSTSDNIEFRLTGNTSSLSSSSITFDLTTDGAGTITGVTANGDGSAFTIDGNNILGATGSIYEGLRFSYVGTDANVTINTTLTQGLADRALNGTDGYTDSVTGLIVREKASLQAQNTDKAQDANEIRSRAEDFRVAQIEKYAKLESDLVSLNVLLDQIRAILGNNDDD